MCYVVISIGGMYSKYSLNEGPTRFADMRYEDAGNEKEKNVDQQQV